MRVLYFAGAADAAGLREETWDPPGPVTAEAFWAWALARHPTLAPLRPACRLARNHAYVAPGESLQPSDEVAILPPVSGG
jgi:MoaE-MoaD fusion protein